MRNRTKERVEHHTPSPGVVYDLGVAGGFNIFGHANFRVVWGYDRIVPIHGEWQEFEQYVAKLTDKLTGISQSRQFTRLVRSVVETRMVPKYLPGNCWHLEMWRPPEEYGSPEEWGKLGEEIIGISTVNTSGPYPSQGEYELCYPLTSDCTSSGTPLPLIPSVVAEVVRMIVAGRERFSYQQRKAAIEQEMIRKDEGFVRVAEDKLRDGLRPFAGESFVTVSETKTSPKEAGNATGIISG